MIPIEATQTQAHAQEVSAGPHHLEEASPALLSSHLSALKKTLWKDELLESWKQVLAELEVAVEEISQKGGQVIPRVSFAEIKAGLSPSQVKAIKDVGVVVVTGGVPEEEALGWKAQIKDYATVNAAEVTGYPGHNIQIYEMYNAKGQVACREHPGVIETQQYLLSLWHASWPNTPISFTTPVSYFDRVRIRQPGDTTFSLDPHIDNGSVERWEDTTYRQCYKEILKGGKAWKDYDAFDASPRLDAVQDMYDNSVEMLILTAPRNQGSIFRAWQGWISMSETGPDEGTLRVLPMLHVAIPYIILRPFFRLDEATNEWVVDLENPEFPGSLLGGKQFLTAKTHPHLRLDKTMVAIPTVKPGDQVYWHCDMVHSVEAHHYGKNDSSVVYSPAVPLTIKTARYLRQQRATFEAGLPGPDFPKGPGETKCVGRATPEDVKTVMGRQAFGLEPFVVKEGDNPEFIRTANEIVCSA
ncbi:hypothetical protein H0H92_004115 [Tricholoma furcatifolium]|nr:hypothetical protein H0H92_004115 [Tricholoma furcatifolium]